MKFKMVGIIFYEDPLERELGNSFKLEFHSPDEKDAVKETKEKIKGFYEEYERRGCKNINITFVLSIVKDVWEAKYSGKNFSKNQNIRMAIK